MNRRTAGWSRRWHIFVLAALVLGMIGVAAPARPAAAAPQKQAIARASFGSVPLGPLAAGTETPVELGTLAIDSDTAAIITSPIGGGKALALSGGAGAAEVRFKAYPAGLPEVNGNDPNVNGNDKYDLVVRTTLTASISDTAGATFGLEIDGGDLFEFFSFGAGGQLYRDGAPISATYGISSAVKLEARIHLARNTADLFITGSNGTTRLVGLDVDPAFSRETLNRVQYTVTGGTGVYTLDDLLVDIERESGPPAIIIIEEPETEYGYENGIVFFMIKIKISNDGGRADGVYLILNLDEFCNLDDLSFLEGAGYVVEIIDGRVVIGIGMNNSLTTGAMVDMKIKIKIKGDKFKLKLTLRYTDGTGDYENEPIEYNETVPPPATTPPTLPPTTPTTPTVPLTPTVLPRLTIASIDIRFKARWDRGGGLRIYGLPLTEPQTQANGVIIQYFERVRFEYHPENEGTEYVVLLGLMGVELGFKEAPQPAPTNATDGAWYFTATGHTINPAFRAFWDDRGGLYTFGYPIGQAFRDKDGRLVQYFERTRLELHPENAGTEYEVLLGLLGEELLQRSQTAPR
ncbi:MAG TPA: hypothetical protein VD886_24580 [Herpetosiphonaceae bacterium]|nr:hypothetical protein [Herpetosiphonaceae bacterium]